MANVDYPEAVLEVREVQAISKTLGLEVSTVEIGRADDIGPAFEALVRMHFMSSPTLS
jgi:hypothetical protein